jgi:hypothetical protein
LTCINLDDAVEGRVTGLVYVKVRHASAEGQDKNRVERRIEGVMG